MRRILFHVYGRPVYSYPAMLYLGVVLGIEAELAAAAAIGLDGARVLIATLILLASALSGARLLFVVTHWRLYVSDRWGILRCADGGASMYGGLLIAAPLSVWILRAVGIPWGAFWDVASFTMLIGLIVTRAGCLLNGCCGGRPTEGWCGLWLTDYRGERRRRFPTQIAEAAWGVVVLAGAIMLWPRLPFPGALFLYSVSAYAAGRLALETTRHEQERIGGLALQRALSGGFVALSLVAFTVWWR